MSNTLKIDLSNKLGVPYQTVNMLSERLRGMKRRCYEEKNKDYCRYGALGITICDEWLNSLESFIKWTIDNNFQPDLTVDRIDGTKGYSPENCRLVPTIEQQNNLKSNNKLPRGVYRNSGSDMYRSALQYKGVKYYCGSALTPKGAGILRDCCILKLNLNTKVEFLTLDNYTQKEIDEIVNSFMLPKDTPKLSKVDEPVEKRVYPKNITYNKQDKKFIVRETVDGKRVTLGRAKTLELALEIQKRGKPYNI